MNEKEFHEHLYDKLWENIIHKENRLWTFLSVYGAAIGLAFGSEILGDYEVEKGIVILILTYWGLELILESDWWSIRNRLMVLGIEISSKGSKGVMPSFYSGPAFSSEAMHDISVFVFAVIGFSVYVFTASTYQFGDSSELLKDTSLLSLLYFSVAATALRVGLKRRSYIVEYYYTFLDLRNGWPEEKKYSKEDIHSQYKKDLKHKSWRLSTAFAYTICTVIFCWKMSQVVSLATIAWFGIFHLIVLVTFYWYLWKFAGRGYEAAIAGIASAETVANEMAKRQQPAAVEKRSEEPVVLQQTAKEPAPVRGHAAFVSDPPPPTPGGVWLCNIAGLSLFFLSAVMILNADKKPVNKPVVVDINKLKTKIDKLSESLDKLNAATVIYETNAKTTHTIDSLRTEINLLKGILNKSPDTTKVVPH